MNQSELAVVRRAYAMQILAAVSVSDTRVRDAFASVRREDFLGPGPWQIFRWGAMYRPTPSADPVYLYTDDVVGIIPERRINKLLKDRTNVAMLRDLTNMVCLQLEKAGFHHCCSAQSPQQTCQPKHQFALDA